MADAHLREPETGRRLKAKARSRERTRQVVYTWGSIVAGLALWQVFSTFVVKNTLFLATPFASIAAMGDLGTRTICTRNVRQRRTSSPFAAKIPVR